MQIDIEDSLTDSNIAVFQSALLYTSTKGNVASNKPIAVVLLLFAPQARFPLLSWASLRRDCSGKKRGFLNEPICTLNYSLYFMSSVTLSLQGVS